MGSTSMKSTFVNPIVRSTRYSRSPITNLSPSTFCYFPDTLEARARKMSDLNHNLFNALKSLCEEHAEVPSRAAKIAASGGYLISEQTAISGLTMIHRMNELQSLMNDTVAEITETVDALEIAREIRDELARPSCKDSYVERLAMALGRIGNSDKIIVRSLSDILSRYMSERHPAASLAAARSLQKIGGDHARSVLLAGRKRKAFFHMFRDGDGKYKASAALRSAIQSMLDEMQDDPERTCDFCKHDKPFHRPSWQQVEKRNGEFVWFCPECAREFNELQEHISILCPLVQSDGGFGNSSRMYEIGEELFANGGIDLMREVYKGVRRRGAYFSQDIWHGIGPWQK